jgi:DNA-3-methyladenine glycosylase I
VDPRRVAPADAGATSASIAAHAQARAIDLVDAGITGLRGYRSEVAADPVQPVSGVVCGEDGVQRCWWGESTPEYRDYHDREWGFPVADDVRLFEKLSLEGFQSGLSWLTILRKREAFRRAFAGFDFSVVADFDEHDVARLLGDASIVRHRGKIEAVINNAQRAVELVSETGSLAAFVWRFEPAVRDDALTRDAIEAHTEESRALARELKRRGWRFVGPTTVYAFMQAMGLVNDHLDGCAAWAEVERARSKFTRPRHAD